MNPYEFGEEDEYFEDSDPVCSVCVGTGGASCWLMCDGACRRNFHMDCIGVTYEDIDEDLPWFCNECSSQKVCISFTLVFINLRS